MAIGAVLIASGVTTFSIFIALLVPLNEWPVVLTVRLRYGMTCRYPGPGPFVVVFPAQVRLPETIARAAVLVDGRPAFTVRTSSDVVTVGLPPPPEVGSSFPQNSR